MIRILIREIKRVPERARQRKEKAVARRGTRCEWGGREAQETIRVEGPGPEVNSGRERGDDVRL